MMKLKNFFGSAIESREVNLETKKKNKIKKINAFISFFSVFIIISMHMGFSEMQSARAIAQKAFSAVVLVVMEDANGQPLSLGSGFFVRNGMIATNFHVIRGASRGYVKVVGQGKKYDISGIFGANEKFDLALLACSATSASTLLIGDSDKISIGDTVYAVGNPQGLEGTFSQGIISGIRAYSEGKLFQLTAPISPGSSGGPILDSLGEVIGIAVASYKEGQNLNFAIPSAYLSQLISGAKNISPMKSVSSSVQSGVFNKEIGNKSTEGVLGEQLRWNDQLYEYDGEFTITLRNKLREAVKNIYCLVIFYGRDGAALDMTFIRYDEIIPGGLAKRVGGRVDPSVKRLTTPPSEISTLSSLAPTTKVIIRILDFQIIE